MVNAPKKQTGTQKKYTDWKDFDSVAYANSYFDKLTVEDHFVLMKIMSTLRELNIQPESWKTVADIGTGPNLYPSMALAPFVKKPQDGGRLDLLEYDTPNIDYLCNVLKLDHEHAQPGRVWPNIEKLMAAEAEHWEEAFKHIRVKANVIRGDLFNLERHVYDALTSVFTAESMTDDMEVCRRAVRTILDAVKPGGFLAMGFIIGSEGYPAGKNTHFPAVYLELDEVKEMFRGHPNIDVFKVPGEPVMRKGYKGVAMAIGHKS
jgi:hypothetical protein